MAFGLLSLPTELICHILLLLTPKDICCCAIACKTLRDVAQSTVHVQYKLELYAQGFTETATLDSIADISIKMTSLKKMGLLWRSGFHLNTVFEETVALPGLRYSWPQFMKCGLWWMPSGEDRRLFIRDCKTNAKSSQTWLQHDLPQYTFVIVDPLQDLKVVFSVCLGHTVTDTEQDRPFIWMSFGLVSSELPHPHAVRTSLECNHTFDEPGNHHLAIVGEPAICGDRIVVYYFVRENGFKVPSFIQVINWRKGHVKGYPLGQPGHHLQLFHLIDEQTLVIIRGYGHIMLYTLRELDGSPQHRITYHLSTYWDTLFPEYVLHTSPSFHGTAVCPDLMPSYVPSLESQIMVLELHSHMDTVILVFDMAIFSEEVIRSETPVEIPWSDWGPEYTWCFPHDRTHRISVFGSKMVYALPQHHIPEPRERLEALSTKDSFYVHIWDFNKRGITRSENYYDPDSPDLLIRKLGPLVDSSLDENESIISNHPYTAAVCLTPFSTYGCRGLFLEQDRLTLTWVRDDVVDILVGTDGGLVEPRKLE